MSEWAPVVAALGTGAFGFGGIIWQQQRREQVAANAERSECYHALIAYSLSFATRAQALRQVMRTRSGLTDRLDIEMSFRHPELKVSTREPLDPLQLHDWISEGYEPINQARSRIEVVGTSAAVMTATKLLDACADVVSVATHAGSGRGRIGTTLIGMEWSKTEDEALDVAARRVVEIRKDFIAITRAESDRPV